MNKKPLVIIGSIVLSIVILIGILFGTGYIGVLYTNTVGKSQQNADTKVFHQTQAYIDGATTDLAKCKREYDESNDPTARKGIIDYVVSSYSNLNPNDINNPNISNWLRDIQNDQITK